jgi:hypothetical protein
MYGRPIIFDDLANVIGGAEGDRTLDLVLAKDALSQLSHCPNNLIIAPDMHEVKEFTHEPYRNNGFGQPYRNRF